MNSNLKRSSNNFKKKVKRIAMKVQVLVAAVNQNMSRLIEKMNISTDAIIINQSDCFAYEEINHKNSMIKAYTFAERGVGLSRNNALMRADGDICLFSDEDICYVDHYEEAILKEFESNPLADMILFNVEIAEARRTYLISDRKRVRGYNCGRYGAVSFAIKRNRLMELNITFSLLFGGGAQYSAGEDSLFLKECIDKGMKVYTSPFTIGREEAKVSSWFEGYTEKFFYDRGALYHYLYGAMAKMLALRFLLTHKQKMCNEISISKAYQIMKKGIRKVNKG